MFFFALLLLFSVFASRALAVFNVTINNRDLNALQLLPPNSIIVKTDPNCMSSCSQANSTLQNCNNNINCLCNVTNTVVPLRNCEQCLFNKLVEANQKPLDVRVGSQAVLSGYASTCQNLTNVTLAADATTMTVPPSLDGPFVATLPVGGVVVAVGSAVILGVSALFILTNL